MRFIILSLLFLFTTNVFAGRCSGGDCCTACTNCSACGNCAVRGGSCSVCDDSYKDDCPHGYISNAEGESYDSGPSSTSGNNGHDWDGGGGKTYDDDSFKWFAILFFIVFPVISYLAEQWREL